MTRANALLELASPPIDADEAKQDKLFVAKKLGVTEAEFDTILAQPPRSYLDYPSNAAKIEKLLRIKSKILNWIKFSKKLLA